MSRIFIVNLIVKKLDLPGEEFDKMQKLKVKFQFFGKFKPVLNCDRININHLPRCPTGEFKTDADCLRERWAQDGIPMSVIYGKKKKKDNVVACGTMKLSENILNKIAESYDPVRYTANVELLADNRIVGMSTVQFQIQQTCIPEKEKKPKKCKIDDSTSENDVLDCHDRLVNPDDVFFVVGDEESNECAPPCGVSPVARPCARPCGGEDTKFDLSRFRSLNGRVVKNAMIGLSQKSLRKGGGGGNPSKPECETPQFVKPPSFCDSELNPVCPNISEPELIQAHYRNRRRCPVCKEDVSWLPKLAACVHCGYKPVPQAEERVYSERVTAGELLLDHLNLTESDAPSNFSIQNGEALPPLPQKSSDDFDTLLQNFKFLKKTLRQTHESCQFGSTAPRSSQPVTARMSSQQNVERSSQAYHPDQHLFSVFTELKNLFDEHSQRITADDICQQASKLTRSSRKKMNSIPLSSDHTKSRKYQKHKAANEVCGEPIEVKKKIKLKKKIKPQIKSKIYSLLTVHKPSHVRIGHKMCQNGVPGGRKNVPAHMGWLWTSGSMGSKPGWRPGVIRRSIRELMSYFLADFPADGIPVSKYMSYLKTKTPKPDYTEKEEQIENIVQLPTLHVLKKNDEYVITLRPLKDPETIQNAANPYMNMKPIQFRIVKNPLLKELREMKHCLKNIGFSKCTCHRPVMECYCRSFIDKKRLIQEMDKICKERNLDDLKDDLVLSDTTESEDEFDFSVTPPAGLVRPERLHKPDLVHCETQYNEADWAMPTLYPLPPNAMMQYGGCAMGERKDRFKWIYGKGKINQVGEKKPKMRNKPKKKKNRLKGGFEQEDVAADYYNTNYSSGFQNNRVIDGTNLHTGVNNAYLSEPKMKRLTMASVPPTVRLAGGAADEPRDTNMSTPYAMPPINYSALRSKTTRYAFGSTIPQNPRDVPVVEEFFIKEGAEPKPLELPFGAETCITKGLAKPILRPEPKRNGLIPAPIKNFPMYSKP